MPEIRDNSCQHEGGVKEQETCQQQWGRLGTRENGIESKIAQGNARIEALQDEMTYKAKNYAKEIAQLKLIIAEKQALLDSLTMGGS
ncbi:unnamed protein product [Paramecium octaurelia]|uniref:Uncharacterized protein n=1 Tax=Paramecium octaurelia TaxID=43137 RepID=A0A8S1VU59_PAROT|nr:unnamed protein product [Paramecium octaurelia]